MDRHEELEQDGYCWFREVFDCGQLDQFRSHLSAIASRLPKSNAGLRIPLGEFSAGKEILSRTVFHDFFARALRGEAQLVRAILFDKSVEAPWFVRWHRDTMIPVREHRTSQVLAAPSMKDGVPHVRATPEILAGMLAIRIHLDDSTPENGSLKVLPGSHTAEAQTATIEPDDAEKQAVLCLANAGDVLLMRPLLLHCSARPQSGQRRVLQLEVTGPNPLPDGFEWYGG